MPPQELTGVGSICPSVFPASILRATVVSASAQTRELGVLSTFIYEFMLARGSLCSLRTHFFFNILPRLPSSFHITLPCNVQLCKWPFTFSSFIISAVRGIKPLVMVSFQCSLLYWKALEVDCAMLFNVVIYCNISIWAPSAHSWETEDVLKAHQWKASQCRDQCCHQKLSGSCQHRRWAVLPGFLKKVFLSSVPYCDVAFFLTFCSKWCVFCLREGWCLGGKKQQKRNCVAPFKSGVHLKPSMQIRIHALVHTETLLEQIS